MPPQKTTSSFSPLFSVTHPPFLPLHILGCGVDTAHGNLSLARGQIFNRWIEGMERQLKSDDSRKMVRTVLPGGLEVELNRRGQGSGFGYCPISIVDEGVILGIRRPDDVTGDPPLDAFFTITGHGIKNYGWPGAAERVQFLIEQLGGRIEDDRVSRLDIRVDVSGLPLELVGQALDSGEWVGHPKKYFPQIDAKQGIEGFYLNPLGSDTLFRVYNKTKECEDKGRGKEINEFYNLDPSAQVIRFEFQVRGERCRDMCLGSMFNLPTAGLWRYATNSFVRFVDSGTATRKSRANSTWWWEALQNCEQFFESGQHRAPSDLRYDESLIRSFLGLGAAVLAFLYPESGSTEFLHELIEGCKTRIMDRYETKLRELVASGRAAETHRRGVKVLQTISAMQAAERDWQSIPAIVLEAEWEPEFNPDLFPEEWL